MIKKKEKNCSQWFPYKRLIKKFISDVVINKRGQVRPKKYNSKFKRFKIEREAVDTERNNGYSCEEIEKSLNKEELTKEIGCQDETDRGNEF